MNYDSKKQILIVLSSVIIALLFIYGVKEVKIKYFTPTETVSTEKPTPKPTKPIVTTEETTTEEITTEKESLPYEDINLTFAGNVKIHEDLINRIASDTVLTQGLHSMIKNSDFSMFNLQTAIAAEEDLAIDNISTNYTKLENKTYLKKLNFKGAALANNYIMQCGPNTIESTMLALDSIGISHTGAGKDLADASTPIILNKHGKQIVILSTTRSYPDDSWIATSKNISDSDDTIGVLAAKETTEITNLISKYKENSDLVIVYMNCGNEYTEEIDTYQQFLAHTLVDSGADLIIGCSPNMVQGIEYYNNIPIIYSLGTFLSSETEGQTALLSVVVAEDNSLKCSLLPCTLANSSVETLDDNERPSFYNHINQLSETLNGFVAEDGTISQIE